MSEISGGVDGIEPIRPIVRTENNLKRKKEQPKENKPKEKPIDPTRGQTIDTEA